MVVARVLDRLLGHVYHGIPERYFDDPIQDCRYWDKCPERQSDFLSLSWTGWIYHPELANTGIRALQGTDSKLVFRIPLRHTKPRKIAKIGSSHLWEHFDCDENQFELDTLICQVATMSRLIQRLS